MECENCRNKHDGTYGSGRFCSEKCSKSFSTKAKRKTINKKISDALKNKPLSKEHKRSISKALKGRRPTFKEKTHTLETKRKIGFAVRKSKRLPKSILDISGRTVKKIFSRMNIGCSVCGWKEGTGDVHHINGRKVENADEHWNLSYLCPNCHRLVHQGLIDKNSLVTLTEQLGDDWKNYYFG